MKLTRRFAVAFLLVAAILLTLGLTACRDKNGKNDKPATPNEYLTQVLEKAFEGEESPLSQLGDTLLTEIAWTSTEDTAEMGLDALNLKLYSSPNAGALELNGTLMETSVTLKGYLNQTALAVQSDLLGNTVYGLDMSKLEQNYASSIFGDPDSMYYMGDLADLTGQIPATALPEEELEKALTKYVDVLKQAVSEQAEATMTDREGGGKTLTFVVDTDDVKAVIRKLYDTAKTDTELRGLVDSLLKTYAPEDREDMMEEYDDFFASPEDLNEFLTTDENDAIRLTLAVLTDGEDKLETATLTVEYPFDDGKPGKIEVIYDASAEGNTALTLNLDLPEEAGAPFKSVTLRQTVVADTKTQWKAGYVLDVLTSEGPKVEMELLSVDYNKSSGDYTLVIAGGVPETDAVTVKGKLQFAKKSVSATLTEVSFADVTMKLDVRASISAVESVPAVPAYTEVLSLTEGQMYDISATLMEHPLAALIFAFGGEAEPDYPEYDDSWMDDEIIISPDWSEGGEIVFPGLDDSLLDEDFDVME